MAILPRKHVLSVVLIALTLPWSFASAAQATVQATEGPNSRMVKVDPPNWWVGFTTEVMLVVSGDHLTEVEITCD